MAGPVASDKADVPFRDDKRNVFKVNAAALAGANPSAYKAVSRIFSQDAPPAYARRARQAALYQGQPPASAQGCAKGVVPLPVLDAESGLNYNVNRDYEPATGRYTTCGWTDYRSALLIGTDRRRRSTLFIPMGWERRGL